VAMVLEGRTALVSGASRGIGRAIAERLASLGAAVAINYVSRSDAAAEVVQGIESRQGQAMAVQADVSNGESVAAMVAAIEERFGPVQILVNNAGITRDGLFARMSE